MRGICPLYGRMIAATVLRMWKNEEEYDPGRAGSYPDTQRLDDGSIGRADQKTVVRYRIREEYSHATPCMAAAEVSIHVCPGLRIMAWRSYA